MSEIFGYRKLDVYKKARNYVARVYQLLRSFPNEERYALCDQLRRAAISVPSNIAEGMGRFSDKEKVHFLEIAYGSLYETMCQIELAFDQKYITEEDFTVVENEMVEIAKMLSGLRSFILKKQTPEAVSSVAVSNL